ncbi:hypothetical protein IG631_15482 [Alternaria alternata]|nr:hypothetical protein IG631_15482 [Alternaria alternata]
MSWHAASPTSADDQHQHASGTWSRFTCIQGWLTSAQTYTVPDRRRVRHQIPTRRRIHMCTSPLDTTTTVTMAITDTAPADAMLQRKPCSRPFRYNRLPALETCSGRREGAETPALATVAERALRQDRPMAASTERRKAPQASPFRRGGHSGRRMWS